MRYYQEEAIQAICNFQKSDLKIAKIFLATGTGKMFVMMSAIKKLLEEKLVSRVLILSRRRILCEHQNAFLKEKKVSFETAMRVKVYCNQNLLLTTVHDVLAYQDKFDCEIFDLILVDEAEFCPEEVFLLFGIGTVKLLGFFSGISNSKNLFSNAEEIYKYTTENAIKDGYVEDVTKSHILLGELLVDILLNSNFENIVTEQSVYVGRSGKKYKPDLIAEKKGRKFVFEIKSFRSRDIDYGRLEQAVEQVKSLQKILSETEGEMICIVVIPSKIHFDVLEDIYRRRNIIIWDISNLIYLCGDDKKLRELLIRAIPYSRENLEEHEPVDNILQRELIASDIKSTETSYTEKFMKELEACKAGNKDKNDKRYEELCTEIVKYLFGAEFFKMSEQHKTEDEMFRMDLLCSLKGTTEFWKFLIQFYNTKFVVFEYKNYSAYVPQNMIYVTEKYLFSAALRNVAIIISRHGFDSNAQKAAFGCLKEHGKLIISITDEDLLKMVAKKDGGEEPSDYLLERVEDLLMSVSK